MRFTCFTPVRLLRRSISAGVLLAVAATAGMPSANAQSLTNTWNGGAGNGNWSTGANWTSGTAPLTSGTNLLRFAGSTQTTSTNSQASLPVNSIQFLNGAAAFTLSGSSIQILGGGGPGIQNLSAADQVINNDLVLGVNSNYHATGGGTLFLNGNISGSSSFTASNGGNIVVGGSNGLNTVNAWIVRAGLLKMNSANALGTGRLQLSSGTTDSGVVGLTFDLNRSLAASGTGTMQWNIGSGGFAAFGATRTVTLSGTPSVTGTWGQTSFIQNGMSLLLSHTTADATLVFANGINLGGSGTTRTIEVRNGSADVDGRMSNTLSGSANLQKTGLGTLELTGNNTYLGTTAIDAGRLLVNGSQSAATGAMTVASGATLGGNGTIGAALTTVNGLLTPGSSGTNNGLLTASGSLTLGSTSLTQINITGTGSRGTAFDAVNVSSALAYSGTLSFLMPTISSGTFNIFDMGSSSGNLASVSGTFGGFSPTWTLTSGTWSATLTSGTIATFNQSTGELVIVPEPTTLALAGLGIGLAGFAAWRRRSGRAS